MTAVANYSVPEDNIFWIVVKYRPWYAKEHGLTKEAHYNISIA